MALGLFWASVCLCGFLFILALDIMGVFSRKNHFDVAGRTVVVTGGSQGMGKGLAKLLAQKGANVVIVARNKQKLHEALQYIRAAAKDAQKQRFLSISADLTTPEENERVIQEVTAWNNGNPPDIVWANAGMSQPMLFVETPVETLRQQMEVNYMAAAYLAQSTLKAWIKPSADKSTPPSSANPRHFIMTSSTACFVGVAGYGPYSPPKAAMRSLADTLRSEANLYNGARRKDPINGPAADIKIHCVCPGTILSPGHENEQKSKHEVTKILEAGDPAQSEDEVAKAAISGLESGGYLITTQYLGHAMRASALAGSPRNNWFVDTVFSWITSIAWLFIGPDLEAKVYNYGKKHGISQGQ
ncbi:3-ketodihydrosphingosine reductase tsc10 [Pseudocercospora fuligena]|uniref:3-dehydrosphinganine reductase n=1 Tax=Pseudocercospora fuligena TaxID=685502 RepID=A0A8H6RVX5_9PEZI|nr:3-ketodihydrosphingosine reductase tsc10 [Pseudocercospora fuligena]